MFLFVCAYRALAQHKVTLQEKQAPSSFVNVCKHTFTIINYKMEGLLSVSWSASSFKVKNKVKPTSQFFCRCLKFKLVAFLYFSVNSEKQSTNA
jgi:hypothetical protein